MIHQNCAVNVKTAASAEYIFIFIFHNNGGDKRKEC